MLLVLGQVHVAAYFNQDEDIGEEDQVTPFTKTTFGIHCCQVKIFSMRFEFSSFLGSNF